MIFFVPVFWVDMSVGHSSNDDKFLILVHCVIDHVAEFFKGRQRISAYRISKKNQFNGFYHCFYFCMEFSSMARYFGVVPRNTFQNIGLGSGIDLNFETLH